MAKTIVIDDKTHDEMQTYAEKNGIKMTWLAVQAIRAWLASRKKAA